jgi:glycosyltransferase involved in cell wall biosynthesis
MAQTYKHIEIIVIDDGSTDDSAGIVKHYGPAVKYFYQPNSGVGVARNAGAGLAKGDYFAFLDCDDIWTEHKLMLQMAVFHRSPETDFVFGHVEQFISPELDENQKKNLRCPAGKIPGYIAGTMVIKRESFVHTGPFETTWRIGEFADWYLRSKDTGMRGVILPQVVLRRRLHSGNMGIRGRDLRIDYVRILKASLDRKRAAYKNRQHCR